MARQGARGVVVGGRDLENLIDTAAMTAAAGAEALPVTWDVSSSAAIADMMAEVGRRLGSVRSTSYTTTLGSRYRPRRPHPLDCQRLVDQRPGG